MNTGWATDHVISKHSNFCLLLLRLYWGKKLIRVVTKIKFLKARKALHKAKAKPCISISISTKIIPPIWVLVPYVSNSDIRKQNLDQVTFQWTIFPLWYSCIIELYLTYLVACAISDFLLIMTETENNHFG